MLRVEQLIRCCKNKNVESHPIASSLARSSSSAATVCTAIFAQFSSTLKHVPPPPPVHDPSLSPCTQHADRCPPLRASPPLPGPAVRDRRRGGEAHGHVVGVEGTTLVIRGGWKMARGCANGSIEPVTVSPPGCRTRKKQAESPPPRCIQSSDFEARVIACIVHNHHLWFDLAASGWLYVVWRLSFDGSHGQPSCPPIRRPRSKNHNHE